MRSILISAVLLLALSSLQSCNNENKKPSPDPEPPTTTETERVMIRASEPTLIIEIRQDENKIRLQTLDPLNHMDMVWFEGPYVPYEMDSGRRTRTFPVTYTPSGAPTDTVNIKLDYMEVAPFECQVDMSGEKSSIEATIQIIGGSEMIMACGYPLSK